MVCQKERHADPNLGVWVSTSVDCDDIAAVKAEGGLRRRHDKNVRRCVVYLATKDCRRGGDHACPGWKIKLDDGDGDARREGGEGKGVLPMITFFPPS